MTNDTFYQKFESSASQKVFLYQNIDYFYSVDEIIILIQKFIRRYRFETIN